MRIPFISLAAISALALGGCAYGGLDVGLGYGGGYGDYGYGYGSPYYGYGGYSGYYGDPFGWYGDYYYPGTGIYVYDSYRRPRLWNSRERSYWTTRQRVATTGARTTSVSPNWAGFSRRSQQFQSREVRQQQSQ